MDSNGGLTSREFKRSVRDYGYPRDPVEVFAVLNQERLSGAAGAKKAFLKMHFSKLHFSKILQIFGGLVLGCIKSKFCKKICV